MKKDKIITICICCIFILFAGYFYFNSQTSAIGTDVALIKTDTSIATKQAVQASEAPDEIAVYICGAVKHPGVYTFSGTARVCDAVDAAGGFKKGAVKSYVNQARFLNDGEQITIPTKHQLKSGSLNKNEDTPDNSSASLNSGLININQATESELMAIPGIGQSRAVAIINYRTEHGNFSKTDDIMNVAGIKEGIYNKIKDKITV